jgi:hypothetical protein
MNKFILIIIIIIIIIIIFNNKNEHYISSTSSIFNKNLLGSTIIGNHTTNSNPYKFNKYIDPYNFKINNNLLLIDNYANNNCCNIEINEIMHPERQGHISPAIVSNYNKYCKSSIILNSCNNFTENNTKQSIAYSILKEALFDTKILFNKNKVNILFNLNDITIKNIDNISNHINIINKIINLINNNLKYYFIKLEDNINYNIQIFSIKNLKTYFLVIFNHNIILQDNEFTNDFIKFKLVIHYIYNNNYILYCDDMVYYIINLIIYIL